MWPDQVSNPGPLTYESGALLTALRGPATLEESKEKRGRKVMSLEDNYFRQSGWLFHEHKHWRSWLQPGWTSRMTWQMLHMNKYSLIQSEIPLHFVIKNRNIPWF